jgi:hypothetical protein
VDLLCLRRFHAHLRVEECVINRLNIEDHHGEPGTPVGIHLPPVHSLPRHGRELRAFIGGSECDGYCLNQFR